MKGASADPFGLGRFVAAQEACFDTVLAELRQGAKRGHWMWFVFPRIVGLGSSPTARLYAIASIEEARAYLGHPVLGLRYRRCVDRLAGSHATSAEAVFGPVDAMKLRSSLTLFVEAGGEARFSAAIDRWFAGERDEATLRLLARTTPPASG